MTKRGFAEVSGHHLEQTRLKRKEEDRSMYDSEGMGSDEANVKKNGSTISINETHAKADPTGKFPEDFGCHLDLKISLLNQRSTSMIRAKNTDYGSEGNVCGDPSSSVCHPDTNETEITGDDLSVKNAIISEKASQPYQTEGLSIQANVLEKDMVGMTINYTSCSTEVEKQLFVDSMPLLTDCGNDKNTETKSRKMTQATAAEKMNPAIYKEDISACTISSAISIEINQKLLSCNSKGEASLPPSPITGVIDSFVGKPNRNNNHLNSLEETAFSFQLPNKFFCKEIPNNATAFEMQGRLGKVAEAHDYVHNLREHPVNAVSIGFHGDGVRREKGSVASFSCRSTSEDYSISKPREKEVLEVFTLQPERSLTSRKRKKLLVLDLNGLLCDIVNDYTSHRGEKKIGGKPIFKRPFCDDFLKFCFDKFDIGIWSSRRKHNVDKALDYLMMEFKHKLLFCWDQTKCTFTGVRTLENHYKPLVLKELKKLWDKEESDLPWEKGEFSPSNTLLLDDSPYKALLNPSHTAIFPYPYQHTDDGDKSLGPGGDVRVYLEQLLFADDVQHYVEEHPFGQPPITTSSQHWNFYCEIIKRQTTLS